MINTKNSLAILVEIIIIIGVIIWSLVDTKFIGHSNIALIVGLVAGAILGNRISKIK